MIKDLEYVASDGVILKGKCNNKEVSIKFNDVLPFWDYSNEDDFESGKAIVFDNKVLFTMLTASSQGGIIVLWNAETNKIEHISEGSYTIAFDMDEKYIYYLTEIFNFETKAHFNFWRISIGCMDACHEGEELKTRTFFTDDFIDENYENYDITMHDGYIDVEADGNICKIELL